MMMHKNVFSLVTKKKKHGWLQETPWVGWFYHQAPFLVGFQALVPRDPASSISRLHFSWPNSSSTIEFPWQVPENAGYAIWYARFANTAIYFKKSLISPKVHKIYAEKQGSPFFLSIGWNLFFRHIPWKFHRAHGPITVPSPSKSPLNHH